MQGAAASRSPRRRIGGLKDWQWFVILVAPNLILFSVFTYWPIIFTFYLSLTDWNMVRPQREIVGFENYQNLFRSSLFWQVVRNTFTFAFFTVIFRLALALFFAVLLFEALRFRAFFRTVVFLPHVTTTAAAAVVWVFVLDPNYGILRAGLGLFSIPSPHWLADPNWAMPAMIIVGIWKTVGFSTVIYLAGLSSINPELQEAARCEGATEWNVFRYVTFPLLTPVTLFLLITGTIQAMQMFELPAIMTEGGPLNATNIYAYHLYQLAFVRFRAGYASAFAVIFFVIILAITFINLRLSKKWVNY
jgi:ABC-type sugar transport system permease subunit